MSTLLYKIFNINQKKNIKKIILIFILSININHIQSQNIFKKDLYLKAQRLFYIDNLVFSKRLFEKIVKDEIDLSLKKIEAEYNIAMCYKTLDLPNGNYLLNVFMKKNKLFNYNVNINLILGNHAFNIYDYKSSIEYYERVYWGYFSKKNKAKLWFKLGYSYLSESRFDQASKYFKDVLKYKNRYIFASYYYLGYLEIRKKNYEQSRKYLNLAKNEKSYASAIPYLITTTYYKEKKFDKLINYTKDLKELEIKNPDEIELMLAEAFREKRNWLKSSDHYQNYILYKNKYIDSQIFYRTAFSYYKMKKYKKALEKLNKLKIEKNDQIYQNANYLHGRLLLQEKQYKKALEKLLNAYRTNSNSEIQYQSGVLYAKINHQLGNNLIAMETLKDLKNKFSQFNLTPVNNLLSDIYIEIKDYKLSLDQRKYKHKTNKILNNIQKAAFFKGSEHIKNQQYDEAINMFDISLEINKDKKIYYKTILAKADIFFEKEKFDQAIKLYSKVTENEFKKEYKEYNDINILALYGLGYSYYNKNEYNKAKNYFNKIINISKTLKINSKIKYDSILRYADLNYALNLYGESLNFYKKYLSYYPKDIYTKLQIIKLNINTSNLKTAQKLLNKILSQKLDLEQKAEVYFLLSKIHFNENKFNKAIEFYNKIIKEFPKNRFITKVLLNNAIANINLKQKENAKKLLEILINDYPKSKEAYLGLLEIQKLVSKKQFAIYYKKYKEENKENEKWDLISFETSKNYFYSQNYEKAISELQEYIEKNPESNKIAESLYLLAQSYKMIGNKDQAIVVFEDAIKYRKSKFYNKSLLQYNILVMGKEKYKTAFIYGKDLLKVSKTKKEKIKALEILVESSYKIKNYESTIKYSKQILKKINKIGLILKIKLFLAKALLGQKEYINAIKKSKEIINQSKSIYAVEAKYLIAEILYEKKEYDKSIKCLFELNKNYPTYQKWIEESFLLIAKNYIALNELYKAQSTLKSLINNSKDEYIRLMSEKLLNQIKVKDTIEEEKISND